MEGKMKVKVLAASVFLVIAAVAVTGYAPAQDSERLITVLNPAVANKMADRLPLSPRLDTLEGKTLYLVDIGWGGPQAAPGVYEEMRAWFAKNIPSLKIQVRRIKGGYETDDKELWKEIGQNANAAMIGIAG
jgi:hypothetical protein